MNTSTCTRRIQFCAGHRVLGHESKCGHIHGHNYVAWLTAEITSTTAPGTGLCLHTRTNKLGMVVDFSVLKEAIGGWIDRHWDHGFIVNRADKDVLKILRGFSACPEGTNRVTQKLFELPYNPTAENMAEFLLRVVGPAALVETGVRLIKVTIDETENCSATASL